MRTPLALWFLLAACTPRSEQCPIDDLARELAGTNAEACGIVGIDEDRAPADDCMVQATEDRAPAWASFQLQGIDSRIDEAWAYDGTTLFGLIRDSDPSGGSGARPTLTQSTCSSFSVQGGQLQCEVPSVRQMCE